MTVAEPIGEQRTMNTDLARLLRIIADGREEYAEDAIPGLSRRVLLSEAAAFRTAAVIADGDAAPALWGLLPTWRLTPDVQQLADRVAGEAEPIVTDEMVDAAFAALPDWISREPIRDSMRAAIEGALRARGGRTP